MKQLFFRIILIAAIISIACTTRVSEWVLLNSLPKQYTMIFFHNGPVTEALKKQEIVGAEMIKKANIQFKSISREDIKEPYWGLYYEDRLFSRYNSPDDFRNLSTSLLRENIASELMGGKLCVMVYLKCENKEKDEKGLQVIKKAVDISPFGKIITVFELSRSSKEEAHFVSLLLNVEDDLKTINEPMLFGVFGRFKALEPLLGKGITEENIGLMIDYLTAECSCLIKDDLPGTDILFKYDWENPRPALLNKIIDANLSLGN
jgi:hypothetical protein